MKAPVAIDNIRSLGFEWPKYAVIEEYCVFEQSKIDLTRTLENMLSSQAYYKKQLAEAYKFKTQYSADYSDFTDRFDEYALKKQRLDQAIAYLEKVKMAAEKQEDD